jgi:DtxR family Mn-dependent transcriptional regulator
MKKLSPAMEDYLKSIYSMSGQDTEKTVRVSDLALRMRVSKACASRATDMLSEKGLLVKNRYRGAAITAEGKEQAAALLARHSAIQRFFSEILHVDPAVADKDACNIEHCISAESFRSILRHLEGKN